MRAFGDEDAGVGARDVRLRIARRAVSLAAVAACMAAAAPAQHAIDWFTIDGGGSMGATGGLHTLGGTIGQPDAGPLSGGAYSLSGGFWVGAAALVGVWNGDPEPTGIPRAFRLHAAVPNPTLRGSRIDFDLPRAQFVRIRLYDAAGRLTRTIAEGSFPAGRHQRVWDGADDGGRPVAAGIYIVRIDAGTDQARRRIVVLR